MKNISIKWLVTLLCCLFLGNFGIHRFINGKYLSGALQLILYFVCYPICLIWTIIDFIYIALSVFTDGDGQKITICG